MFLTRIKIDQDTDIDSGLKNALSITWHKAKIL